MKQTKRAEAWLDPEDQGLLADLTRHFGTEAQVIRLAIRALHKDLKR